MIKYILFAVIVVSLQHVLGIAQEEPKFVKYLHGKCNAIQPDENRQLRAMDMYACAVTYERIKDLEDYYKFFCMYKMNEECVDLITSYFVFCLSKKEQYLTDLIVSSYKTSKDKFCKAEKSLFIEQFSTISNLACVKDGKVINILMKCLNNLHEGEDWSDFVLTKKLVCGNLADIRACVEENVAITCENSLIVETVSEVFKPYLEWCRLN